MASCPEELQAFSTAYVAEAIRQSRASPPSSPEEQIAWYNRCVAGHALGLSLFRASLAPADKKQGEK